MRVPPAVKELLRRAAAARGQSITEFAIEALSEAARRSAEAAGLGGSRPLGWAVGTARELGDIVPPATDLGDWDALQP
jgi:hypothetical protein